MSSCSPSPEQVIEIGGALVFEDNGAATLVETKRVYAAVRGGELGR